MIISKYAVEDYLDRDFDSFTWMKKLPRRTLMSELWDLRVPPVFKTAPWTHQLVCFYIAQCYPEFLFLLDMGLGKTKIIADIITQKQREKKIDRALVTVPRFINMESWADDLLVHSELEPCLANISDIEAKQERLLNPTGDLTIIDYQGLHWAVCKRKKSGTGYKLVKDDKLVRRVQSLYQLVAIDESHKLGNHDSLWFSILRQITKTADYTYAMTGTLFGKQLESIWSQYYLVDRGETFGENLGLFRGAFFDQKTQPWKGTVYIPKPGMSRTLNKMIRHRSIQYDEDEVPETELPARVMRSSEMLMSDEQQTAYLKLVQGIIDSGGDRTNLEAGVWAKLRQVASGYLAWEDKNGAHLIRFKDNPKLHSLDSWLERFDGEKMVISCEYTETGRMICDHLTKLGISHVWYYGGTKDQSATRRKFLDDPRCRVFVMNSEAGGTGTDGLQKVSRAFVFFEEPCSPITWKQTLKRVHRSGQKHRTFIISLRIKKTVEMKIRDGVKAGVDLYEEVVKGGAKITKGFLMGDN